MLKTKVNKVVAIITCVVINLAMLCGIPKNNNTVFASGVDNIVARANYLYNSTWVAQKNVSGWDYTFIKGKTYRIPYGQPVTSGKYICFGVSVDDYLAAAADASSIFYTSQSYYSGSVTRSTYYATDCSGFVSYCWGISRTTTAYWANLDVTNLGKVNSTNVSKIQKGDALNLAGSHIVLVTAVNSDGTIEITEQTPPQLKRTTYTQSKLISNYGSYTIYRYNKRDSVPAAPGYHSVTIHYNANGGTVASDSNYYIGSNNDLYRKSDNKLMGPTWEDGYKDENGLINASTLKLTRSGYTFLGWSLQKSGGKVYDQNDSTVSANDLYPNITKQSGTVMLYAQWAKNTVAIHYNANGGTVASDSNYYVGSNNDLYRKSDNKLMGSTWEDGYKDPNGLFNASTIKLTKSGYYFLGWSLTPNAEKIFDQNDNSVSANDLFPDVTKKNGTVMLYARWGGHVMSENEGAGQTIPDGDYWIVNGLSTHYMVDIPGDNYDTANGTNLKMHMWSNNNFGEYDVFTVQYLNNGFYRITQRKTNMCVDVNGGKLFAEANVNMWTKNNSNAQQWSIKKTENGYTLQSRCCGFYLDVKGGTTDNANLQVYPGNNTKSQLFSFIPYNAGQPIQNGVYRIGTIRGKGAYIDAAGEPGEYKDETKIQIWDAGADNYFRFEYCENGFYKIYDNVSGLALDIYNPNKTDYLGRGTNVQLYKSKDTLGQYWAIKPAGDGYYYIISKLNGYYLDLNGGKTTNGTNIQIWQGFGDNQKWSFVTNKELSVTAPTKTTYYIGEKLDTTGMIVKMTYSDGYSMDVTKNVKLSCDMLTAGTKNVTVTYEQGGLKSTANFAITVKEKEVTTPTTSTTTTTPITSTTTTSTTTTTPTTTTVLTTTPSSTTTTTIPTTNPKPIEDFDLIMHNGERYTIETEPSDLIFKSNNTDVAVVSKSGVITAIGEGKATITVIYSNENTSQIFLNVISAEHIKGDLNSDGKFDVADVILLQKWLLAVPDVKLADWKAADLCEDGRLDVFDLCLMKRMLVENS